MSDLRCGLIPFVDAACARKVFNEATGMLSVDNPYDKMSDLVIYEMTDGMRTSTRREGADAYFDGGVFSLRLLHILKLLGCRACYVNVIEERHRFRENYISIFEGLRRLYAMYEQYADENKVRLRFLGDLEAKLEPQGMAGDFSKNLRDLEERTDKNTAFTACFLVNYSLRWAMKNERLFDDLPDINTIVRHTKLQVPTDMLPPPSKSDYSSIVYVQQGSSSERWSDSQLIYLVAVALRCMMLNYGTQYLRIYSDKEKEMIRSEREDRSHLVLKDLVGARTQSTAEYPSRSNPKRIIMAGPFGPEIYTI